MSTAGGFSPAAQCGHKLGYSSKAIAKKAAREAETRFGGGRIQAYACSWCSGSETVGHIGHRPPSAAKDRRILCAGCGRRWEPRARVARNGTVLWALDSDLARCRHCQSEPPSEDVAAP